MRYPTDEVYDAAEWNRAQWVYALRTPETGAPAEVSPSCWAAALGWVSRPDASMDELWSAHILAHPHGCFAVRAGRSDETIVGSAHTQLIGWIEDGDDGTERNAEWRREVRRERLATAWGVSTEDVL